MESPRYITRLRVKSSANPEMSSNLDEIMEHENAEQTQELDFESLINSVESKDSKILISILENQNEKMKEMCFGIDYLKMKVKAINSRVKDNEEKIANLEQDKKEKDSEISKLKTDISALQQTNRKLISENESIKQSVENQGIYIRRKCVIFTGVKETANYENPINTVESLLTDKMQLNNIEVKEAYRRGPKRGSGPPRPLIAKV